MKKFIIALALACCLFIAGCQEVTSGTVIGHRYDPPHTETYMMCYSVDPPMYMPMTEDVPERHFIQIEDEKGQKYWICVTKKVHDTLKIGDKWKKYDTTNGRNSNQ